MSDSAVSYTHLDCIRDRCTDIPINQHFTLICLVNNARIPKNNKIICFILFNSDTQIYWNATYYDYYSGRPCNNNFQKIHATRDGCNPSQAAFTLYENTALSLIRWQIFKNILLKIY